MKAARFHPEAEAELDEAVGFYERRCPGLGLELQAEVVRVIGMIRRDPERHPIQPRVGTRKCRVRRFPFSVYDLELENSIWIAAIAHQKRKPGYWKGREPD